jgi:NADPH:quinone reductase-like Zn-dependent oxidoreductase
MKAVRQRRYGGPEVLEVVDLDEPEPGPGEVRVRMRGSSVNMADIDYVRARPWVTRFAYGVSRPKNEIPGTDVAGEIDAVGEGVTALGVGDRVFADSTDDGFGAWAEKLCLPAGALTKVPDTVDLQTAGAVPNAGVLALQGVEAVGGVREGDRVLVNGAAGNVGPFAIQIARARGAAEITAVDAGAKLGVLHGIADRVLDYTEVDFARTGERYDFILDCAATRGIFAIRRALTRGGRYALLGGKLHFFFRMMAFGWMLPGARLGIPMWQANAPETMGALADFLDEGALRPLVDRRFPLDEVPEAIRYVESGAFRGKVLIEYPQ